MTARNSYIRYIIGALCALGGIIFMFIPFIPLGYVLLFAALLLLSPNLPFVRKLMRYLRKRDKNGHIERLENKLNEWEQEESPLNENKNSN